MRLCMQTGGVIDYLGMERGYAAIAKAGFSGVDWDLKTLVPSNHIRALNYKDCPVLTQTTKELLHSLSEEVSIIQKNGLAISQIHAPFPAYVPGHPEVLEDMIGVYQTSIRLCESVQCPVLVIHGISHPREEQQDTRTDIETLNYRLFRSLIPVLNKCPNVIVCLENMTISQHPKMEGICSDPYEAVRYVDTLNADAGREAFGICLDTGHLNVLRWDFRTWIPVVGHRIRALHLHDNDGQIDQHRVPTTGLICWDHVLDGLNAIGYRGDLTFEAYPQTAVKETLSEQELTARLELVMKIGNWFRQRILSETVMHD